MYEELLTRLKNCISNTIEDCVGCPYQNGYKGTYCMNGLIAEGADAIKELCVDNDHLYKAVINLTQTVTGIMRKLNKQKWIPVTEQLPEDNKMVIGFTPCDGYMFVGYHVTSIYHDRDFSHWNIITAMRSTRKMTKKVTHWMPLPELPKEETA